MIDRGPAREPADRAATAADIGEYCRKVEDHLTRASGGHLVRIVGPGFEIVRRWAEEGVPLSVVIRGIDMKADRHRSGQAARPLRIEFCEADVRTLYDDWRRAVGLHGRGEPAAGASDTDAPTAEPAERRKPSLSKQLDRAIERLSQAAVRSDVPDALRDAVAAALDELTALREDARRARGSARDDIASRLAALDARLVSAARAAASAATRAELERDAALELAPYRDRLPADAWQRAIDVTVDRALRAKFSLTE